VTFDLLGSSTEDLFFPRNYLIVEGSSDQVVAEKVLALLGYSTRDVKVLSAQGVDEVRGRVLSVVRALVPLVVNDSPYADRVVALIDAPAEREAANVERLQRDLGERLFILPRSSIEEYVPETVYIRAGRSKEDDAAALRAASGHLASERRLKREISDALAAALVSEDLAALETITEAARRAAEA
jgi:hypothetical protein